MCAMRPAIVSTLKGFGLVPLPVGVLRSATLLASTAGLRNWECAARFRNLRRADALLQR